MDSAVGGGERSGKRQGGAANRNHKVREGVRSKRKKKGDEGDKEAPWTFGF